MRGELLSVSSPPGAVTGGDAVFAIRGLGAGERISVRRNGRRVIGAFGALRGGERRGRVRGLRRGLNTIEAAVRRRGRATRKLVLRVRNHPLTGPVISGPHQKPFYCETRQSGLGAPIDSNCSVRTRYQWPTARQAATATSAGGPPRTELTWLRPWWYPLSPY
jgi:hypothetical protein